MKILGKYELVNNEKFERALNGVVKSDGTMNGGVGEHAYFEDGVWKREGVELTEKEVLSLETALIAEYDKFGGAIRKGNDKVKLGCFYDFKGKKAFDKPKIITTFLVNGKHIDVVGGEEEPGIVKAAKILKEEEVKSQKKNKKGEDE